MIAAVFGIYAGTKGDGTTYSMVLGFVPGATELLASLLNINMAITWLHLAIGVVTLGVAYGAGKAAAK